MHWDDLIFHKRQPLPYYISYPKIRSINLSNLWKAYKADFNSEIDRHDLFNRFMYTAGGYAEDRKSLWDYTYLKDKEHAIHLGIDLLVPANTIITSPRSGEIVHIWEDEDNDFGWGTRIILKEEKNSKIWNAQGINTLYWVFGHLQPNTLWKTGDQVSKKDWIGAVADRAQNGNVFEHLHLQCCSKKYENWEELDGYGSPADLLVNHHPLIELGLLLM